MGTVDGDALGAFDGSDDGEFVHLYPLDEVYLMSINSAKPLSNSVFE